MKNTKIRLVRNKILDDLSNKRPVIAYDDYTEVCTNKDFTNQINYVKRMLGADIEHFLLGYYKHSATAYRVNYN